MAITTLTDASITVGGDDFSDHCVKVEIDDGVVELDGLVFSNTAEHVVGGLDRWTITATFKQDFAASNVNIRLRAVRGTNVAVVVKPTSGSVSSTNPSWTGTGFFPGFKPLGDGTVGEIPMIEAVFKNAGTVLAYATS